MATRAQLTEAVAESLRDFGYPDVTAAMVGEVLDAWNAGKRGLDELPHGVIGIFCESQFNDLERDGIDLVRFAPGEQQ